MNLDKIWVKIFAVVMIIGLTFYPIAELTRVIWTEASFGNVFTMLEMRGQFIFETVCMWLSYILAIAFIVFLLLIPKKEGGKNGD